MGLFNYRNINCAGLKVLISTLLVLLCSCAEKDTDSDPDLLARVGKQRLTRGDLDRVITPGLTQEDSITFARAYVKSWVDRRVMTEVATRNIPDMKKIDQMVDDYRNELISWEYSRLMFAQHGTEAIPDDSIESYYKKESRRFVLVRPVIKGVYIKIADNSPALQRVKKLYKSKRDADIDRLEKQDLQGVIHYDYFRDHWVDWEQIETRIPGDFGSSADLFLSNNKHYEISANGFTHLLEITEYQKSGTPMPIEMARDRIVRELYNLHRGEYDSRLRLDLLGEGIANGTVVINTPLQ